MSSTRFQWDKGNRQHVIDAYPKRENSQNEVESLFDDPYFRSMPDLAHSQDEVRFNAVTRNNQNHILFVVFIIRDEYIRPISCRRASSKQRDRYVKITTEKESEGNGG